MATDKPVTVLLTTNLVTIERSQPLSEVYHILKSAPFHHLPVMEDDKPVGMISSVDILRLAYDIDGFDDQDMLAMLDYQFSIDDAMSTDLRTLPPTATVAEAAAALADGKAHSVLIVDRGELVGIVTTTDLVRFLRDM
ncbi:MAG: CBS domain-containing protein [Acidimicrobiia bacterium]|nr:CBS domain-containing protein [Acidimicrobiia bacterium]